jgi:hypothetical protein
MPLRILLGIVAVAATVFIGDQVFNDGKATKATFEWISGILDNIFSKQERSLGIAEKSAFRWTVVDALNNPNTRVVAGVFSNEGKVLAEKRLSGDEAERVREQHNSQQELVLSW